MEHNQPGLYKNIDITIPALPPRSILYSIEPIGIGTPYVESLASYINRLAVEHSISVADLFIRIISIYGSIFSEKTNTFKNLWKILSAINNASKSSIIVEIMSELTIRSELKYLTLATIEDLNINGALSKIKRYCPKCYEEQKASNNIVYDPLIWSIRAIKICPIHRLYLLDDCPNKDCVSNFTVLNTYSVPGCCPCCYQWLGSQSSDLADDLTIESQKWIIKQIGDLIAEISVLSTVDVNSNIKKVLKIILEVYGNGNAITLSEVLEISDKTIRQWNKQQNSPSLNSLLKICAKLNISLLNILKYGTLKKFPINNNNVCFKTTKRPSKNNKINKDLIKSKLEELIQSNNKENPLSVKETAKILGVSVGTLYNHFPEICNYIVDERRAFFSRKKKEKTEELCRAVKEEMINIYNSGQYPSKERLGKILGFYVFFIPEVRKAWEETIKELGLGKLD